MTLRPDEPQFPGEQPEQRMRGSEEHGEQPTVSGPADPIFTSWGHTARALAVAVVVVGVVALAVVVVGVLTLALWLLRVDISIGPLRITRRR